MNFFEEGNSISYIYSVTCNRMRPTTVQFLLLLALFTINVSCSGQSLAGIWKVQQIKLVDMMHGKTFTIDLTKPDKLKREMLTSFLSEPQEEGFAVDTAEIKADIEKTVASYLKSKLTISNNGKYSMVSNGLIVMNAVPGWHVGDSLEGTWTRSGDILTFSVGDGNQGYEWNFKILQLSDKGLKLQQISQGAKSTKDRFDGPKSEIEFVRQ